MHINKVAFYKAACPTTLAMNVETVLLLTIKCGLYTFEAQNPWDLKSMLQNPKLPNSHFKKRFLQKKLMAFL
jgi:hypothetical protein